MDDKGYLDETTVIKATQTSERQPYDVVRQALKNVELDSSRRVELDDYVDVSEIERHKISESFLLTANPLSAHSKSQRDFSSTRI